jgi:hypothetical protein
MVAAAFDWVIALDTKAGSRTVSGVGKFVIEPDGLVVNQYHPRHKLALA